MNGELRLRIEARRLALDESCMGAIAASMQSGLSETGDSFANCEATTHNLLANALFQTADAIVLCAHWSMYSTHATHQGAMRLAENLAASGRKVFVVGIFAMQDASSIGFVAATRRLSPAAANELAYRSIHRTKIDEPNRIAESLANQREGITFIDKRAVFVDDTKCIAHLYGERSELLFADNAHLTSAGLEFLGKSIASDDWFSAGTSLGTTTTRK
jgi:hypothetical protein